MVRDLLPNVKQQLRHVQVKGEKKIEIEEMMDSYVVQCENAMKPGKREELQKILQMKSNEHARARQNKALAKAGNRAKTSADTAPTPKTSTSSASTSSRALAKLTKRRKEVQKKRRKRQPKQAKMKESRCGRMRRNRNGCGIKFRLGN